MLSDTLRMIAGELKLCKATGAHLTPETVTVLHDVLERVAIELAVIETALDAPPRRLTQDHLQDGNIVMFPIGRRPFPGGMA
jgi:hypothetical protein